MTQSLTGQENDGDEGTKVAKVANVTKRAHEANDTPHYPRACIELAVQTYGVGWRC